MLRKPAAIFPHLDRNALLQWGRSGMLRKPSSPGRRRLKTPICFNGAGAECSGNRWLSVSRLRPGKASMGPERNAPETISPAVKLPPFGVSFNGAGAECSGNHARTFRQTPIRCQLQWGRSGMLRKPTLIGVVAPFRVVGFNGAGAECSGNRKIKELEDYRKRKLQWGRSGMLRKPTRVAQGQFIVGFSFNGAGAECSGNLWKWVASWAIALRLQWGRSGMLRKPRKENIIESLRSLASMGPERNAPETR